MSKPRLMCSWSSGKDSAWALHTVQQQNDCQLVGLFTTVNMAFQRVAMHGVRLELLRRQAECMGLPLTVIEIPYPCSNAEYEQAMSGFIDQAKSEGIEGLVFGDLFLQDIRDYREKQLAASDLSLHFPLWGLATEQLAKTMVAAGLKAIITCVDPKQCPKQFAGREFNAGFLGELAEGVDPCGENGEFHTFVYDGPMFNRAINVGVGDIIERDGFVFADVFASDSRE